jgi:hypothetical protein
MCSANMRYILRSIPELSTESVNSLARSYHAMSHSSALRSLLSTVCPDIDINALKKRNLHEIINRILLKSYKGEEILKYFLIREFLSKQVTAAFELKVNTSRVDFLTINGHTSSFEIKSELDNLKKLVKQVNDYVRTFEYNYIVIDKKHLPTAISVVPDNYGVWVYEGSKKEIVREATKNTCLNPSAQVQLFTKKELKYFFNGYQDRRESIVEEFSEEHINEVFKRMLKMRYTQKWAFIKAHRGSILPVDFHFFFHNNISPNLIYGVS